MCVLSFCTTFAWNIFHSKKNLARYDKKRILAFVQRFILIQFELNIIISNTLIKNTEIPNFMKIRPLAAD
jgi:hypothetical protein